jgi:hypothetical protein
LIEGELLLPDEGGLPKFVVLEKVPVERKLPPRVRSGDTDLIRSA